jgi:hypothetical protein
MLPGIMIMAEIFLGEEKTIGVKTSFIIFCVLFVFKNKVDGGARRAESLS